MRRVSHHQPLSLPETPVIWPREEAWVERPSPRRLRLRWRAPADEVQVLVGFDPDDLETFRPLTAVRGAQEAALENPAGEMGKRPFFLLRFVGGPRAGQQQMVAERFLPLEGGVNFRDLGGYPTRDGRRVRWGKVYRAGLLSQLSDADLAFLARLPLRCVYDFRSETEAVRNPDRLPQDLHLRRVQAPMRTRAGRWRQLWHVLRLRRRLGDLMRIGYTRVVLDENAHVVGAVLRQMADPVNLPLVFHCTAGKDRTGVVAALLLALLDVPDEVILADYSLSNLHLARYAPTLARDAARLTRLGFSDAQIRPILIAEPALMRATLDYLRRRYGSVDAYAQTAAGLDPDTLERMRANLLGE
jgi:protein-tyrosine phosphatase